MSGNLIGVRASQGAVFPLGWAMSKATTEWDALRNRAVIRLGITPKPTKPSFSILSPILPFPGPELPKTLLSTGAERIGFRSKEVLLSKSHLLRPIRCLRHVKLERPILSTGLQLLSLPSLFNRRFLLFLG